MASNEPTGNNRRIGAVKRTQRKGKLMGKTAWTRSKNTGRFMDAPDPSATPNKMRLSVHMAQPKHSCNF